MKPGWTGADGFVSQLPWLSSESPISDDDVLTVYKAVQRTADPKNMAIFGTFAGDALTLSVILRAKEQGVALPGANFSRHADEIGSG